MANSILPDLGTSGAVVYRDAAGNPTNPPNVQNAYPPLPLFTSTCELTALPSDCDARIEPRQVNAIVSELLSFAECLNPDGNWDCDTLRNLCTAFTVWMEENLNWLIVSDTPPTQPPAQDNKTLWWEADTGYTYLWYNDGTSKQWVQIAGGKPVMDKISIVGEGITSDPHSVGLVDCGVY